MLPADARSRAGGNGDDNMEKDRSGQIRIHLRQVHHLEDVGPVYGVHWDLRDNTVDDYYRSITHCDSFKHAKHVAQTIVDRENGKEDG